MPRVPVAAAAFHRAAVRRPARARRAKCGARPGVEKSSGTGRERRSARILANL